MSNDPKTPNSSQPSPPEKAATALPELTYLAPKPAGVSALPKPSEPTLATPPSKKLPSIPTTQPATKLGNKPELTAETRPETPANPQEAKPANVYLAALQSMKESSARGPKTSTSGPDTGDEVTGSFVGIEDLFQDQAPQSMTSPEKGGARSSTALSVRDEDSDVMEGAEEMTGSFTGLDVTLESGKSVKSVKVAQPKEDLSDSELGLESFADLFADEKEPAKVEPARVEPAKAEAVRVVSVPRGFPASMMGAKEAPATPVLPMLSVIVPTPSIPIAAVELPRGALTATRPSELDSQVQDPLIGAVLLHYKVLSKIAEGGMGVVYKAQHVSIHRMAAVKLLKLDYCRDEAMIQRFYQEGRLVNQIRHENIIDIFDFGKLEDGRVFYIMEFLEGETVADRLTARGPLPFSEAYPIMEQATKALRAVHEQGVIHRDLKPDNFWLIQRDQGPPLLKILDFGIAKLVGTPNRKITKTGSVMGTPQYMAPEQLNNQQPDIRSDIYSLGIVFFELFTGDTPFGEKSLAQVVQAHLGGDLPPLPATTAALGVPPGVRDVIARCTALNPEDRYPSLGELLADLTAAAGGKALSPQTATLASRKNKPKGARGSFAPSWLMPAAIFGGLAVVGVFVLPKLLTPAVIIQPLAPPQSMQTSAPVVALEYGALRDTALSILRKQLTSKDPRTRASAALALGDSQDTESLARLVSVLVDLQEEPEVRAASARGLGKLGDNGARAELSTARREADDLLATAIDAALMRLGDSGAARKLQAGVRSRKAVIRYEAAMTLAELADERMALGALRGIETQGLSPEEQLGVMRELARMGDKAALDQFKSSLSSENEAERLLSAANLARLGSDIGRDVLKASLDAKDDESKVVAAIAFLYLGDFSGVERLKEGLAHENPVIRRHAAQGLQVVADEAFLPLLERSLSDQDPQVQVEAASAMLGILGLDPSLLARAGTSWIEKALSEEDVERKIRALRLARELPDKAALSAYKKGLADENDKVQIAAAKGLAVISRKKSSESAQAIALLKTTAEKKGVLGIVSQGGLAASGDIGAKTQFVKALNSRDKETRAAVIETAANTNQLDIVEVGLQDKDFSIRLDAARALADKRNAKGEAVLQEGLTSEDPRVRTQAYAGLKALGRSPDASVADPTILITSIDPRLRIEAANLSAEGKGNAAVVRKAVYDADPAVRIAGLQAATKRKDKNLLRIGLRDPNPEVKATAELGLLQLSDKPAPSTPQDPGVSTPSPPVPDSPPVSNLVGTDYEKLKSAKVKMANADVALAGGRPSEALKLYQDANKVSAQPDIQWYYAECYRKLGDNAKNNEEKKKQWGKAKTSYERFASSRKTDSRAVRAKASAENLDRKIKALPKL